MHAYIPADDRATVTLFRLMEPYIKAVNTSVSIKELTKAIAYHFPFQCAHLIELRLRMELIHGYNPTRAKFLAIKFAEDSIIRSVCETLQREIDSDSNFRYYYMREDIIRWFESQPWRKEQFNKPEEEVITVEISSREKIKTRTLTLTEDQMIGITYGLTSMNDDRVVLYSSITENRVSISNIANHALIYRLPIDLATEKLKRPYSVDIVKADKTFQTLHFINPEFMQGVLSVAHWYGLPYNGKDILWKNLTEFTKQGVIPLQL